MGIRLNVFTGALEDAPDTAPLDRPGLQLPRVFGTIPYAAQVTLNFATLNGSMRTITLTGALELLTSNLAAGRELQLLLVAGAAQRTLTFPAQWRFLSAVPANVPANRECLLSLGSYGTTNAEVRAIAAVQP
jgi:hypothetical protein